MQLCCPAGKAVCGLLQAQEGVQVIYLHPKHDLNGEGALGGTGQAVLAGAAGAQHDQAAVA